MAGEEAARKATEDLLEKDSAEKIVAQQVAHKQHETIKAAELAQLKVK